MADLSMNSPDGDGPDEDDLDPVFAPWDGRRVPVTLIGGYLGAGKTTVINELLARATQPIAVLVNDVGQVNIDARLIERHEGDTIELTNGCVCCSLSEGLLVAFDQLRDRALPPDHVVIELSGVADPARVVPWTATPGFRLDGVVVLVDADQFLLAEAHDWAAPAVRMQIESADVLVLTKIDLASPEQLDAVRQRIAALAPNTPLLESDSTIATAALLAIGTRHPDGVAAMPEPSLFDQHVTTLVPLPLPTTRAELDQILDRLDAKVLRAKAIAATDDGMLLVQVVGSRRTITALPAAELEWATDLVVISAP